MSSRGTKDKDSINDRAVIIIGKIIHETDKAILLATEDKYDKKIRIWLPKSQLKKPIEERKDGVCVMRFPVWIVEEKNLDYLEVEEDEIEGDEA